MGKDDKIQTIPSTPPEDESSVDGILEALIRKVLQRIDNCLPVIVDKYDRKTNLTQVQPAIDLIASDGRKKRRNIITDIPALNLGAGGFIISFPIKKGDTGWIIANDRDISLFKQKLEISAPNTYRKHSFNDAVFIPDKIINTNIEDEDNEHLVIKTLDNSTKFVIKKDGFLFKGNTNIKGDTIFDGDLTINGDVTQKGNINIEGDITQIGNINQTGNLTTTGIVTAKDFIKE